MPRWNELFGSEAREEGRIRLESDANALLPTRREHVHPPSIDPKEVTKICLRLKHQIEQVIPYEIEEDKVTKPNSPIITNAVLETANKAGGDGDKTACVVYCLLMVKKWFAKQATAELWDADMHDVRAVACEMMAKRIIEAEEDMDYLFEEMLLKRYTSVRSPDPRPPRMLRWLPIRLGNQR